MLKMQWTVKELRSRIASLSLAKPCSLGCFVGNAPPRSAPPCPAASYCTRRPAPLDGHLHCASRCAYNGVNKRHTILHPFKI